MNVPLLLGEVPELPDLDLNDLLILVVETLVELIRQLVLLHCQLKRPQILVFNQIPLVLKQVLVIIIRVVHLSYQLKHQRHQVAPCDLILDGHLKTELDPLTEKHAARDSLFITFVFQKKGIKDLTVIFEGKRYLVH